MSNRPKASNPVKVFFSYSQEDERLRDQLEKHLSVLTEQGFIESWHNRKISAGTEWENQVNKNLDAANIILLLVSSDFLGSKYCYAKEMNRAMQRHELGEARVIPIILRPCEWQYAPFGRLPALPTDGKAVSLWKNKDRAFANIAQGIRMVAGGLELPGPEQPKPEQPNKIKRFEDWIIKQKHWPLLLSSIIPIYFLVGTYPNDPALLLAAGITSLFIGILYWAVQRQVRRLWQSGALGILGSGLIVAALAWPVCSLLKQGSNEAGQNSDKPKLVVTIARFSPDDSTPRSYARTFNKRFQEELFRQERLFTIKTYNAEVEEEDQEKTDARIRSSESCNCNVFVSAVIRGSDDEEESADFNLHMADSQAQPDGQDLASPKPVKRNRIVVKDQKDYTSLVKLLVAYAYYEWKEWDNAINILKQVREKETGRLRGEAYFHEGMCHVSKGLETSDRTAKIAELEGARDNFENASRFAEGSISLDVESQLNFAYTQILISKLLPSDDAKEVLNNAISTLEDLSKRQKDDNNVLTTIHGCDPAKINLLIAYFLQYQVSDQSEVAWLDKAQKIVKSFNAACSYELAISRVNIAVLLASAGLRSNDPHEFKEKFDEAIEKLELALGYFESKLNDSEDKYLQGWVTAANNLANKRTLLGSYLETEGKQDLEKANELYERVLGLLSKDEYKAQYKDKDAYLDHRLWTKSNQAATLIELGKLDGTNDRYFEDAIRVCQEVIDAYGQSQGEHWVSAKINQATALRLLGSRHSDQALLDRAIAACREVSEKVDADTLDWALNEKTWGDAYYELSSMSQATENLRKARERYQNARFLCRFPNIILQKVCSQLR